MITVISRSFAQTQKLAARLAKKLHGSETIALRGGLGTGKTQFVKGLAKALKIRHPVTSPTFVLMKCYRFKRRRLWHSLYHLDFYRIKSTSELETLGIEKFLNERRALIVIEWPEKFRRLLPKNRLDIFFSYGKKTSERKIKLPGQYL